MVSERLSKTSHQKTDLNWKQDIRMNKSWITLSNSITRTDSLGMWSGKQRTKPALVLLIQQFIPKWKDLECAPPHHWPLTARSNARAGSLCLHSYVYKLFSISGCLTTTNASVRRNKGFFNRRNSLKCKAKVVELLIPAVRYPARDTGLCPPDLPMATVSSSCM